MLHNDVVNCRFLDVSIWRQLNHVRLHGEASGDVEAMRRSLVRKLEKFVADQEWRGCPWRACRRARVCTPPQGECLSPRPKREMTEDEWSRVKAQLKRALQRRLAEIAAARGERAASS